VPFGKNKSAKARVEMEKDSEVCGILCLKVLPAPSASIELFGGA
jgi:hypothetical protein